MDGNLSLRECLQFTIGLPNRDINGLPCTIFRWVLLLCQICFDIFFNFNLFSVSVTEEKKVSVEQSHQAQDQLDSLFSNQTSMLQNLAALFQNVQILTSKVKIKGCSIHYCATRRRMLKAPPVNPRTCTFSVL